MSMINNPTNRALAKKEKEARMTEVLATKGLKGEMILGYCCFTYKGKEYRVRTSQEIKHILDGFVS
jgi:hypothetical protein